MLLLLCLILASIARKIPETNKTSENTEEINEKKGIEVSAEEETMELMKEWDEKMQGFVPEDMVTFEIAARGEEAFFEIIDVSNTIIRGAWFLSSGDSRDIDFAIYNPLQVAIFERKGKKEGIFYIESTGQGIYVFKFKNNKVMKSHTITFTFIIGNSTSQLLQSEHLTPVEENLVKIQKGIKDFQVDHQFAQLRQETHYKTVASASANVLWFSIFESIGIVGVTAWQIYYIKKLLDNRRVL